MAELSSTIEECNEEELRWWELARDELVLFDELDPISFSTFQVTTERKYSLVSLQAKEYASLRHIARVVQAFLRKFRPNECWASTYSRSRIWRSGGYIFVTADRIIIRDAEDHLDRLRDRYEKSHGK